MCSHEIEPLCPCVRAEAAHWPVKITFFLKPLRSEAAHWSVKNKNFFEKKLKPFRAEAAHWPARTPVWVSRDWVVVAHGARGHTRH
jgi:hypothetical protein